MKTAQKKKPVADKILVEKAARKLTLFRTGSPVRTYRIALGKNPEGPKVHEGDGRTPEGLYVIDWRNPGSAFHLSLHISYPNTADRKRAEALGVAPGGDIMIHGVKDEMIPLGPAHRQSDWTEGCIAVTNDEIEEIWDLVPDGAVVEIVP